MARTRQKAKQRKAKRLEQERKAAERSQPRMEDSGTSGALAEAADTRREQAELDDAQREAAAELQEAQRAAEVATAPETEPVPVPDGRTEKPSRRDRRKEEVKPERRKPEPKKRPARTDRKEARQRGRVINFFIQVWAELRRVQWPTRSQVTQATAVVVVFCLIAGAYLGIWDYVFNKLIKAFL
jgi:preprotein translocase subunit SecE